jgi:hypothetical protein
LAYWFNWWAGIRLNNEEEEEEEEEGSGEGMRWRC